jgi:hypothetical protein
MKRLLDSLMIVSLVVAIAPVSEALFNSRLAAAIEVPNWVAVEPDMEAPVRVQSLSPFRLVDLARNGYFKDQGIPSHAGLVAAVQTGRVTAEDLVQSAITDRRLPADKLSDRSYLNAVDRFLERLLNESNGRG